MQGKYLLAYAFIQNGVTGVGSTDMTMKQDQPITPEVIQDAIKTIRKDMGWDDSVTIAPLSWCRYEQPADNSPKVGVCRNQTLCRDCDYFRAYKNEPTNIFTCSCTHYRKAVLDADIMNVTPTLMKMGDDI